MVTDGVVASLIQTALLGIAVKVFAASDGLKSLLAAAPSLPRAYTS